MYMSKYKRKTNRLDIEEYAMSQEDVAKALNISQQAVYATELRGIKKMRKFIINKIPEIIPEKKKEK
jgi:hypothetical protein